MSKREYGTGSIFQRKDGTWTGRVDIGTQSNGKRKIKAVYGKTESEVKKKLKELRNSIIRGEFSDNIKSITIEDYARTWLTQYKKNEVKPSTYDLIESTLNNIVFPILGMYQLSTVVPADIQYMINTLTNKGYSYSTIKRTYNYVNAIYKFALEREDISKSPIVHIILPKAIKKDISDIVFFDDYEISLIKESALVRFPNSDKYVFRYGYAIILF